MYVFVKQGNIVSFLCAVPFTTLLPTLSFKMYDKEKLLEILLRSDLRTIQDNGKPYPPSATIYRIISEKLKELDMNLTPKHIYVIINENRNGFRDKIVKTFNIELNNRDTSYNMSSSSEVSRNTSINAVSKEFDIIISGEQWKIIMPVRKLYGRRYKYVLQSGWTDIISEKMWQQQKFSCTVVFKKHDIHESRSANCYIDIRGSCKECDATIKGKIIHRPRHNADVKLQFTAHNVIENNHSYKKKRQLRGKRRQIISNAIIDQKLEAVTFRRQEAKRLKDVGDVEPSIIPSAVVLRKAKEETLMKRYGFLYTNSILNILQMAKHGKYSGYIRSIGLLEFFCIYWSSEQQVLYKSRRKKSPTGFMTLDATGGIIKRNSHGEPPIFLYQCMYVSNDGSIPVFQMVSADHKAMHIAYFLQKIISAGNEPPRMVVCDFGWAILIAVAQIFGKCIDLRHYLKKCFNIVHGNNDTLPSCFIRLDVSHYVSMIAKWNCLKGKDKIIVKKFYLRCLCQAYKMISFEELCVSLEAIFVVALSQYVGSNENGEDLPSELHLQYLNNMIKYIPEIEIVDEIGENRETDCLTISMDLSETDCPEVSADISNWFHWSANIYDKAQQIAINCIEGTAINACYNPDFAITIKTHLIPYVALWSGMMQPYFQIGKEVATSTSVEAEFADLKNRAFKGQLPMKPDKFIHDHLDYIDGKIKLASHENDILNDDGEQHANVTDEFSSASSAKIDECSNVDTCVYSDAIDCNISTIIENNNKENISLNTSDVVDNAEQLNCNVRENWRGLLRKSPQEQSSALKQRKPTYLDKCPEWDYIKLTKGHKIPIMRNGNVSRAVCIDGKSVIATQTCAFDAMLHLLASSIATIKCYKNKITSLENQTINLAISILQSGKIKQFHYDERFKILKDLPLFRQAITNYSSTIIKLNANCNVGHLITYLFQNAPSCRLTTVCPCGYLRRRQSIELNINIDVLLYKGLQYMQDAIDDGLANGLTTLKCRKCLANTRENIEYGPHVFIDTSTFTDDRYVKTVSMVEHNLAAIAKHIKLNSQTYILTGVVHYIRASDGNVNNGHYVAYARCGPYWYEYDDTKKKRGIATEKKKITPHLIFYVNAEP